MNRIVKAFIETLVLMLFVFGLGGGSYLWVDFVIDNHYNTIYIALPFIVLIFIGLFFIFYKSSDKL